MAALKRWFGADEKVVAKKAAKQRGEFVFVKKGKTKDNAKVHVLGYYVGVETPGVPGANTIERV
jgi:hypothetical protein